ncbi:MAG TPA: alpha/beta fold hydrolase [Oligoflexia bacterium]|nr:alpha/beta fold hydrolase [Oligoflexia bacterium]HMR24926.1 alpha/beta fold hydrolase [Oligoflexia bacterium]
MKKIDWLRDISLDELQDIPYNTVDKSIVEHDYEQRGFVSVPVDYSRPEGPSLDIFYRFMPAHNLPITDNSKPIVVVINGGPGMASYGYRPYDFDYTGKVKAEVDYLGELLNYFRVLIIDQRGTDGNSAPLDLNNPNIKPEIIARYFDSHHIARDQQEVIQQVLGEQPFYMIAQSYGGMVGMSYLTLEGIERLPKGICFSAAAMPHSDFKKTHLNRRKKQKQLNLNLEETLPNIGSKILQLRDHFTANGLEGTNFHYLWRFLGQSEFGHWQNNISNKIDELLAANKSGLETFIENESGSNFLNYILSNPMSTPNYTDTTLSQEVTALVPYEKEWMLDECFLLQRIGRDGSWREELINQMDAFPHPGTHYASPETIKDRFRHTKVLFSLADDDIFLPLETVRENSSKFYVKGISQEIVLPGGHKAIFLPKGVKAFYDWTLHIKK